MFSNPSGCARIRHHEDAERHFKQMALPKSKSKYWEDHQRPLDDKRKHHYRLEQGDGYYDVVLYSTIMVRYYAPDKRGFSRVCYTYDERQTSTKFMWQVLGNWHNYRECRTTHGCSVEVPLYYGSLGTDLMFAPDGNLVIGESHHREVYTHVMSDTIKEWRATVRKQLCKLTDVWDLRKEAMVREWTPPAAQYNHPGRPFSGSRGDVICDHRSELQAAMRSPDGLLTEANILLAQYDMCAESILNRRDYIHADKADRTLRNRDVEAAVLDMLTGHCAPHVAGGRKPIPMFPEHLPKRFSFV